MMPASAASEDPIAQLAIETRSELWPNNWSSSGLSTEARIDVPTRVRLSRYHSPPATSADTRMVIT